MLLIVLLLFVMMYLELEQHLLFTRLLWLWFVFCRSWSNTIHFFIFNSYRHCGADGTIDKSISPWFDSLLQSRISVASQPPYSSYNDIQLKMMSSQSSWKILLIQTPSWPSSTLTLHFIKLRAGYSCRLGPHKQSQLLWFIFTHGSRWLDVKREYNVQQTQVLLIESLTKD